MIRIAERKDLEQIVKIYEDVIKQNPSVGWVLGVYPTKETAKKAIDKKELYVKVIDDRVVATAKINQVQEEAYRKCSWEEDVDDDEVMVIHTLSVSPKMQKNGIGKEFMSFYEDFAKEKGCKYLRMDTNETNTQARKMYKSLGYKERGKVLCEFNGILDVGLICLEKKII